MSVMSRERCVLRPVRPRDRRRSLPGVPAAAGGGTALLQRTSRLLCRQPSRRRRAGSHRPRDLHLGPRGDTGLHPRRHPDAARDVHLRGPAHPHEASEGAARSVHAAEGRGAGAEDPRFLRPQPGRRRRLGAIRLHRRSRRSGADADDRHASRHSGVRAGVAPSGNGSQPAHRPRASDSSPRRASPTARAMPNTSTGAPSIPPTT